MERSTQQVTLFGTRMAKIGKKVALLSTGDELTNGDVLNTNSQTIALELYNQFIQPGLHLTASDEQIQIEESIRFLLKNHEALIITGGLGPTSDDRTRFALSQVLNEVLEFDEHCWQHIVARLQSLSLPIPENNRIQCLFPRSAEILPNDNGTAAGCLVMHEQKPIFMLPGPPFECRPMVIRDILPYLLKNGFSQRQYRCEWLLTGVSEGSIAELLDPLIAASHCSIGYRVNWPYLEVKLQADDESEFEKMRMQVDDFIGLNSVSPCKQKASQQLKDWIISNRKLITIDDRMSGGLLAIVLLSPDSHPYLRFTPIPPEDSDYHIVLTGLENYWHNKNEPNLVNLTLFKDQEFIYQKKISIPFRKERTPLYAVELCCWEILSSLSQRNL